MTTTTHSPPTPAATGGGNAILLAAAAAVGVGIYALTRTPAPTPVLASGPPTPPVPTTTVVTVGPTSAIAGTIDLTVVAHVLDASATLRPAGSVTFTQDGLKIGTATLSPTTDFMASASLSIPFPSTSHNYAATFTPTNNTAPSTSAPVLASGPGNPPAPQPPPPTPAPTTTVVTVQNVGGWKAGQILNVTATVHYAALGPIGSVSFTEDGVFMAIIPLAPWSASVQTTIKSGTHSYGATFNPTNLTAASIAAPVLVTAQ